MYMHRCMHMHVKTKTHTQLTPGDGGLHLGGVEEQLLGGGGDGDLLSSPAQSRGAGD